MSDQSADPAKIIEELRGMGVRQFVRWFSTPARSGFFFSPADIQRIGTQVEVSIAPFNRTMAIEQFLRGAALDGRLDRALEALEREMTAQLTAYRELDITAVTPWIIRAEATLSAWAALSREFFSQD